MTVSVPSASVSSAGLMVSVTVEEPAAKVTTEPEIVPPAAVTV